MNINTNLNIAKFNQINKPTSSNYFLNKNIEQDTVSFSGKKRKEIVLSEYMQNSINIGTELYDLYTKQDFSYKLAEEKMKKHIPILSIDNMENIPKEVKNPLLIIKAYLNPKYNDNGDLYEMRIHIPPEIKTTSDFSSIVHEYTHAQQRYNDDSYLGAFTLLGERNITKARGLNALSTFVFNQYEARKGDNILKKAAKLEQKGKDPEKAIAEAFGFKTVDEYKKVLKNSFDGIYNEISKGVLSSKENIAFIPFVTTPDKLKDSVRKMCVKHAEIEYEAYEAQKQFIKKVDKHNMSDSVKMQPVFYKLIADALA